MPASNPYFSWTRSPWPATRCAATVRRGGSSKRTCWTSPPGGDRLPGARRAAPSSGHRERSGAGGRARLRTDTRPHPQGAAPSRLPVPVVPPERSRLRGAAGPEARAARRAQGSVFRRVPSTGADGSRASVRGPRPAPSMARGGWRDADRWASRALGVAPTLVGGSDRRGGADLGPTGTKKAWARTGVDGGTVADAVPGPDFAWAPETGREGMVRITTEQAALLQGFPPDWRFAGKKAARCRQIGHASPPPVARALGPAIRAASAAPASTAAGYTSTL